MRDLLKRSYRKVREFATHKVAQAGAVAGIIVGIESSAEATTGAPAVALTDVINFTTTATNFLSYLAGGFVAVAGVTLAFMGAKKVIGWFRRA